MCIYAAVAPVLDTVYPSYGVVSGGTPVTIKGTFEARVRPVVVLFGPYETTDITYT